MSAEERLEQVMADNAALCDRNRQLDAENALLKQRVALYRGRCERALGELDEWTRVADDLVREGGGCATFSARSLLGLAASLTRALGGGAR